MTISKNYGTALERILINNQVKIAGNYEEKKIF